MANSRIYFKSEAGGTTVVSRDTTATSGNLVLPASGNVASVDTAVTDNAIARYDGATGKLQNSGVTIDDNGNIGTGTQSFNGFGGTGFKNYIINGDMRIDQWNNGAVVNVTSTGEFVPDRFQPTASQTGKITAQRRVSAAVAMGDAQFENCLQILTVSGYSLTASDQFKVTQKIEGLNIANLRFGKINAKKITLSFWVRSSVVGLHCVSFRNSTADRSYVATYTIDTVNNFEYKTITINGDTSGTWLYDTGIGLRVDFNLASGSTYTTSTPNQWVSGSYSGAAGVVNDIATTGNEFIITGIQLEEGSMATPFEQRPIGLELSLCQRYYQTGRGTIVKVSTSAYHSGTHPLSFPCMMRATPTISFTKIGTMTGTNALAANVTTNTLYVYGGTDYNSGVIGDYTFFTYTTSAEL